MLRFIVLLSGLLCFTVGEFHAVQAENISSLALNGTASLWEYASLCEFKDTKYIPLAKTYAKGSYSSEGCQDLENRFGRPTAVIVSLPNNGTKPLEIVLPGLNEVTLQAKDGLVLQAIAIRDAANFGMGTSYSFMTTMTGSITFPIPPGEKIDLIFLFSKADIGDKIFIGAYQPMTISQ